MSFHFSCFISRAVEREKSKSDAKKGRCQSERSLKGSKTVAICGEIYNFCEILTILKFWSRFVVIFLTKLHFLVLWWCRILFNPKIARKNYFLLFKTHLDFISIIFKNHFIFYFHRWNSFNFHFFPFRRQKVSACVYLFVWNKTKCNFTMRCAYFYFDRTIYFTYFLWPKFSTFFPSIPWKLHTHFTRFFILRPLERSLKFLTPFEFREFHCSLWNFSIKHKSTEDSPD